MTEENIFDRCARIFQINNETEQRNETIKLLNEIDQSQYTNCKSLNKRGWALSIYAI